MISLITPSKAQQVLCRHVKSRRLLLGLTQEGLAGRSGVSLSTLRKFERSGQISLESFLKLLAVLDVLEPLVEAVKPKDEKFRSIDDVLRAQQGKFRKIGWRK